jgi:hypothetical protein
MPGPAVGQPGRSVIYSGHEVRLGTGWYFFSASQRAGRRGRVVHPLPRGDQIGQGVVSRSACTSALPPCCSSVVWPTPGAPRTSITHHSVAAVPQPAHGPLLFRLGPVPPGAARRPHAQHGSTPRLSGRESRTTASVELRFPGGDIRYPAPGSPAGGGQGPSHVLVGVSRTESSIYTDQSGGFVRRHAGCYSSSRSPTFPRPPRRESSCQRKRKRSSVGFAG